MADIAIRQSRMNSGTIFATMISDVDAGHISNCSIVPRSRSLTIAAADTNEPFRMQSSPKIPVTVNQELTRPGL